MLAGRLPDGTVSTDPQTLREHATDSWPLALLRRVRGDDLPEPAAVISPATTGEVATVLAWASQTGTAVVPRGAGSGVCGGATADSDAVVLDLSRMDRIGEVDAISHTVEVQAGVRGDRLEQELAKLGLTTGHYPQSVAISTVGGWIAASSAGQASTGFGAIEDVLLGLTAVLPDGEILRLRPVPRSAAGPDLRRLLIGSEGTLAVVTEATLACRARPTAWDWLAFGFEDFTTMAASPERRQASRDRRRRPARVRRDRRPAGLRRPEPHDRVRGAGRLPRPDRPARPGRQETGRRRDPARQRGPNSAPATASTGGSTATTRCRPSRRSWGRSGRSAPG